MSGSILEKVGTRLGNIDDLPDELKKQIPEFALEGLDEQVYIVLKDDLDGIASLSEVMIALYHHFKVADKSRTEITDAIYRLIRKKMVKGVKGRKAIYALMSVDTDFVQQSDILSDEENDKTVNQVLTK